MARPRRIQELAMKADAVAFDIYGTLIDIKTDEKDASTYEEISSFLAKYDFKIKADALQEKYFAIQRQWSRARRDTEGVAYPEVRMVDVFREIITKHAKHPRGCPDETFNGLAEALPLLFRQLTIRKKKLLPHITPTLEELSSRGLKLSIISNAQSLIAIPELNEFGLMKFFYPIIISSDVGVKKPEGLIFETFLKRAKLKAKNVVFVGNDMRDDIHGAKNAGMKTVFVDTPIGLDEYKDTKPDAYIKRMDEILEHI